MTSTIPIRDAEPHHVAATLEVQSHHLVSAHAAERSKLWLYKAALAVHGRVRMMKRVIVLGLSILCWASHLAPAGQVDFEGTFLDLLVELDANHGVTIGLDPFELGNPKITEIRKYRSGTKSATDLAKAEAKRIGLLMKAGANGAFYATSAESSKRDRRLSLFLDRKYDELIKIGDQGDSLIQLAKLINEARIHSQRRVRVLNQVAGKAKSTFPGLDREMQSMSQAKAKGRAIPDTQFRQLYQNVASLSTLIADQVGLIDADYNRYIDAEENAAVFGEIAREYGSLALATRALLEYMVYRIEPVSRGIAIMDPYNGCARVSGDGKTAQLTKPGSFASNFKAQIKADLKRQDAKCKELGRALDQGLKERSSRLGAAITHWKAEEFGKAYENISLAVSGGDLSSKTRALYGLFWTQSQSAFVKEVRARGQSSRSASVSLQAMAAMDEAFVEKFQTAYPGLTRGSVPRAQNPGRLGASYGLTVSRDAGQVSTFGIRTKPRTAGEAGGALISAGAQQIEVNAVGQGYIDDHMIASIRDSLSYVSGQHVPELFDERIVVIFDSTVDIAYGGDSAGAALASAALSQSKKVLPPADVCMTGAVRSFGDVRPVGGIVEKTAAARSKGFRVLLAPLENATSFYQLPRSEQIGPCQIILGKTMNDYLPFGLPDLEGVDTAPRKALAAYSFAYHLYLAGKLDESLGLCERALELYPNHFSARSLATALKMAGAKSKAVPETLKEYLAE